MICPAFDQVAFGTLAHPLWVQCVDAAGTPFDATGTPGVTVFDDSTKAALPNLPAVSGTTRTGLFYGAIDISGANGFARGKTYLYRWQGVVDGVARVGVGKFQVV